MNGNSLFLDSNVIIYFFSGDDTLTELLEGKNLYISVITKLELLSYNGLSSKDKANLEKFLSECTVVELTPTVQAVTVEFRKKYKLKLPDSIIVASALCADLPLISADKALKNIKEISILLYEKK